MLTWLSVAARKGLPAAAPLPAPAVVVIVAPGPNSEHPCGGALPGPNVYVRFPSAFTSRGSPAVVGMATTTLHAAPLLTTPPVRVEVYVQVSPAGETHPSCEAGAGVAIGSDAEAVPANASAVSNAPPTMRFFNFFSLAR